MKWWRKVWDVFYALSSSCIFLLLGIIFWHVLLGIPIDKEGDFLRKSVLFFQSLRTHRRSHHVGLVNGAWYDISGDENRKPSLY